MSPRATVRARVVAVLVATACSDPAEPPLPDFSVSPATQWSGGTLTIRSPYFANRTQAPTITAGRDSLVLNAVDDSTVTTTLPPGASGTVVFGIVRGNRTDSIGSVQRVGFTEKRTVTPALEGELLATDSAGTPFVLGGFFTGRGNREPIVRLRVVPGASQVLALHQPSNPQYGFAPSIIPGAFTVRDSTDSIRLATLLVDTPTIIDSMHRWGTGFTRQVAKLSDSLWLVTNSHQSYTRPDSVTSAPTLVNTESPWAVYMSPSGTRTTLATTVVSGSGVPVWDNATGSVAFNLPVPYTEAAAFSADGSVLYAVGGQQIAADTLVAVDATTGALAHRTAFPNGLLAMGITYREAVGGGQLLVGAATPSSLVLLVYRASTLELLGSLPTNDACPDMQAGNCFSGVVSLDAPHNRAYIVIPGDPTPIWTFDLLP